MGDRAIMGNISSKPQTLMPGIGDKAMVSKRAQEVHRQASQLNIWVVLKVGSPSGKEQRARWVLGLTN